LTDAISLDLPIRDEGENGGGGGEARESDILEAYLFFEKDWLVMLAQIFEVEEGEILGPFSRQDLAFLVSAAIVAFLADGAVSGGSLGVLNGSMGNERGGRSRERETEGGSEGKRRSRRRRRRRRRRRET
jgi:hypothetical protein